MEIPKININKVEIHKIPVWKTDVPILDNVIPEATGPSIPFIKK